MGFVKVASVQDLPTGMIIGVESNDKLILVANIAGTYYAIGDSCTHRGCKLSSGKLKEDGIVVCPCHGSLFDVKTGDVVKGPAVTPEPSFSVKVEKDDILVNV